MACKCGSDRILSVNGKTSDLCFSRFGEFEHDGYVPRDVGVGGGDYIEFEVCLECGQIQDEWPKPDPDWAVKDDDEEEEEEEEEER